MQKMTADGYHINYVISLNRDYGFDINKIEHILKFISEEKKYIFDKKCLQDAVISYRKSCLRLAVVVPTYNRCANIRLYLNIAADMFRQYGVDLIIYDSSDDDATKKVVENCDYPNVFYRRYKGSNSGKTLDRKVFSAAEEFAGAYQYIWICRDRSIPNFSIIYNAIQKAASKKYDFMVMYPHWIDPQFYGFRDFTDCNELLEKLCGEMTSLGSIIFSSETLCALVSRYPVDEDKNYGMWIPIALFHYIADRNFRAFYYINNTFTYLPGYTTSFWISSNTLLWLWAERWPVMISGLPDIYNKSKADVMNFKNWTVRPFSKLLLLPCRAGNGFRIKDVIEHRKNLHLVTDIPIWKIYALAFMPSSIVSYYLNASGGRLLKALKWIYKHTFVMVQRLISSVTQAVKNLFLHRKRAEYSGINYLIGKNCVDAKLSIQSCLLCGSVKAVDEPWISIVIPTYKRVSLLKDALNSVLNQRQVDFKWDVLVVDNEPYKGAPNETQRYIEKINNPRVLYYRNVQNLGAGGNMNRCVELARGKWIAFLHDDDLLISEYLYRIEKRIREIEYVKKPLGYISGTPEIFYGCSMKKSADVRSYLAYRDYAICSTADNGKMFPVTQSELPFTGSVGVVAPTTGTLILKEAFIRFGGYNEELNLSADLILAYRIMSEYAVYRNESALGFYRWFDNTSKDKLTRIEADLYDFRESIYRRNFLYRLLGFFFRQEHFGEEVSGLISMAHLPCNSENLHKMDKIMVYRTNMLRRLVFKVVRKCYRMVQKNRAVYIKTDGGTRS